MPSRYLNSVIAFYAVSYAVDCANVKIKFYDANYFSPDLVSAWEIRGWKLGFFTSAFGLACGVAAEVNVPNVKRQ